MLRFPIRVLPLAALLAVSACGDGPGTSVTINAGDGNVVLGTDANGQVAIDTPAFKGKFTLPKVKLDASNFDMNGVHLYPGSTISAMTIDAQDKSGNDRDAKVRVTFASPAAPAAVRDWFKTKLNAAKFSVAADGTGLSGTTDDNEPFKLDLTAEGTETSKGVITIG